MNKIKTMKPNPYGTGRDDLLIKTPSNGLIKNNILTEKVKRKIVIDSGMKALIELLWDNNIQTRGSCYGHTEEGKEECVAWVDVNVDCFTKACQLAKEIQFDKPLGISNTYHKMVFFNKRDFEELNKWNIFPFEDYMLITSVE